VNHDHTPESAEKVVAGIQAAGGSAMAVAADVSSRAEYQTMVEQVLASWGRWDVLVNNAAVASQAANRESNPSLRKLSGAIILHGAFARTFSCSC
jgi:3-oxoacyl-[acyl-carrier protein] reductase